MDKRFCDIVLVSAAILIGIPVLMLVVYYLWAAGIWPFSPLKPCLETIELQNGGKIEVEYTPWRDLLESGWHAKARYLNPHNKRRENVGEWFDCGYNTNLHAYALNDLVIFWGLDGERLHVRNRQGFWREFQMLFPSAAYASRPLSYYCAPTSLSVETLERIQNELTEPEKRYFGSAHIEKFDVAAREFMVTCPLGIESVGTLFLKLSDDGSHLELQRIEKSRRGFRLDVPDPHQHRVPVHEPPHALEVNWGQFREVTLDQDRLEQKVLTKDGRLRAFTTRSAQGYQIFCEIVATGQVFEIIPIWLADLPFGGVTWVENRYLVFDQRSRDSGQYAHHVADTEAGHVVLLAINRHEQQRTR